MFNFFIFISSFIIFLTVSFNPAAAYTPPIGIPDPGLNWGTIHPIEGTAPSTSAKCPEWPDAEAPNCYYVDNSALCSDSGKGYLRNPRCSIPPILSSGAYVEIHGGPYDQPNGHPEDGTKIMITAVGDAGNPVWIRGPGAGQEPVLRLTTILKGQYILMEYLKWDQIHANLGLRSHQGSSLNHVSIRNSIFQGDKTRTHNDAVISIGGDALGHTFYDIVLFNNIIHDFGDNQALIPNQNDMNDYHGVKIGSYAYNIWVLNNQIYDLGGDAVQIGESTYPDPVNEMPHRLYVGGNSLFGNFEDGVDVKRARDVIISGNTIYKNTGTGVLFHYGSEYMWVIYNKIHTLSQGIVTTGGVDGQTHSGSTDQAYFIGNLIHNIRHDPNDPLWQQGKYYWSTGGAIQVFDAGVVRIVNNTFYDYDLGIQRPDPANDYPWDPRGACHLTNNIFANRTWSEGYDILYNIEMGNIPGSSEMDYNLFSAPARIVWGDGTVRDVIGFLNVFFNKPGYKVGSHSLEGDPKFIDPQHFDFHLQSNSPARDKGGMDEVYQTFFARYQIDIKKDFEGMARPLLNPDWDLGAYEYDFPGVDTGPPTTTATPGGGNYNASQDVVLNCSDGNGSGCDKIYFTLDGSIPTFSSPVYSLPVTISTTTKLQFFARDLAGNIEPVKSLSYVIPFKYSFDCNGDGKADILWRNKATGQVYVWSMNGTTLASAGSPGTVDLSWEIEKLGDFDGDGKSDILWRHIQSGEVYVWLMKGTVITAQGSVGTVKDLNWEIRGVGDFNQDGKGDILWRNKATGQVYIWLMNGTTIAAAGSPGTVDLSWKIERLGDFNGDGKSDILWRHTLSGQVHTWLMDGTTIVSQGSAGTVSDQNWEIKGVGDFNGDGKDDILWRHAVNGQTYIWLMKGFTITSQGSPGTVSDRNWEIKGLGDFCGDGKADILWRNKNSGLLYVWRMNGTTYMAGGSPGMVGDLNWEIE